MRKKIKLNVNDSSDKAYSKKDDSKMFNFTIRVIRCRHTYKYMRRFYKQIQLEYTFLGEGASLF